MSRISVWTLEGRKDRKIPCESVMTLELKRQKRIRQLKKLVKKAPDLKRRNRLERRLAWLEVKV